jgi:hypothetical protein
MTKEELEKQTMEWKNNYILKLEKENLYYKDIIESNSAEWEEQGLRVAKLEKENAKLKAIVRNTKAVDESFAKLQQENAELKAQIEKMKSVVISEKDEALRVEDVITYAVLNDIIDKLETK